MQVQDTLRNGRVRQTRGVHGLTPGRTGVRACLHICADCLRELSELGAKTLGERDGKSAGEVEA